MSGLPGGFQAELWISFVVGLAAVTQDLARRTVSNWLPLAALAGGVACQTASGGLRGAGGALVGAVGGFVVFLVFYLLGGMGGGDIKLMAGFGAILGAERLVPAAVLTAIIGALLACGVLGLRAIRPRERPGAEADSIPYAPAIVAGAWLTLYSST